MFVALQFRIPFSDRKHTSSQDLSSYEQLSEFQRGRISGLKEAGWANRGIVHPMGESDAAIRRCCQEWVDNDRFQRHDGSDRPRFIAVREDRLIVRYAVTASDSSLPTIRCVTRILVSTITIHKGLIQGNLRWYRPLRYLPLPPAHCRAILQWFLAR
ncbi:HTH_Tnp_Tc3_2 domain-containing protein [Trichonephila clavipes]|nr:HTH_Tnp_Tc3_2 domain-containing protein [Trichonephila clavipes]